MGKSSCVFIVSRRRRRNLLENLFYNCFMALKSVIHILNILRPFQVRWVQQQHEKIRKKRDYQKVRFPGAGSSRLADPLGVLRSIATQSRIQYRQTDSHLIFPDPLFKEQWYMVSTWSSVCFPAHYLFNLRYRSHKRARSVERNRFAFLSHCDN